MNVRSVASLLILAIFSGPLRADGGTAIAACIAALSATGGFCDFRNMNAQSAAATITVNKPVTLLLDGTQLTVRGSPGINIQANGVRIRGTAGQAKLIQGVAGNPVIGGATLQDLEIQGITFTGIACSPPANGNHGIYLKNTTTHGAIQRVRIVGNSFANFCFQAIKIQNAVDVDVVDNFVSNVSDGIRFSGVDRGTMIGNKVLNAQQGTTSFVVALGLDSTNPDPEDNVSYPPCSDIQIVHNIVQTYENGEAILVHAGHGLVMSGNVLDDVLFGIGVSPFNTTDLTYDITITGNTFVGTKVSAGQTAANYGIFVGGSAVTVMPSYVVVSNNTVSQANWILRAAGQSGIAVGGGQYVTVAGNIIHDSYVNGISLTNPNTGLLITGNYVNNLLGTGSSGLLGFSGVQNGRIRSNFISNATTGYNFTPLSGGFVSLGLFYGINDATGVGTVLAGGGNVTTSSP